MQTSLSYGVLPTREQFEAAFERLCPSGRYNIRNCKRIGNANLMCHELWNELDMATSENESTEESLDWASCVLSTLEFEWI